MASLMEKPGGRWSLQFRLRPRTERQTIALGGNDASAGPRVPRARGGPGRRDPGR